MGLFDKLKNVFFEEEYVEVEEPIEKPRKIAKKIEIPETKKVERIEKVEPVVEEEKEEVVEETIEQEPPRVEPSFKFPMTFEEEDFKEEKVIKEENKRELEKEREVITREVEREYVPPVYERKRMEEKPVFRPTPIISPIYGILDKNYKKEEIVQKREVRISSSNKKMDLDSVRNKAYGDLSQEIKTVSENKENEVIVKPEETIPNVTDDSLLYDLNDNSSPVVDKVTVGDAEEYFQELGLEYNVDYKDTSKDKATGRRVQKLEEKEAEESKVELHDVDNDKPRHQKSSDDGLESNLFDLIDSMYEDKE